MNIRYRLQSLIRHQYIDYGVGFLRFFFSTFKNERITITAGHLAYVSLLSLVPLLVMVVTILSAFPAFSQTREAIEGFIFNNFVPHAGGVVQEYITEFVGNASQMSGISILSLMVVALLLIGNVDKTLNHIWRTPIKRRLVFTFSMYWMVLTLGPFLMGASVIMTSYLVSLDVFSNEYVSWVQKLVFKIAPFLASMIGFFILYMVVPNKVVKGKHALFGAFVAALLFDLTKGGFAFYIKSFPSYQVIYGALAVIPILFIWVYLSWIVVLVGAIVTVSIERYVPSVSRQTGSEAGKGKATTIAESGTHD